MTKTKNSESDYIFFSSTKIRIFFKKKSITPHPPTPCKLNGLSLRPYFSYIAVVSFIGGGKM
jgi:hypothetical protein